MRGYRSWSMKSKVVLSAFVALVILSVIALVLSTRGNQPDSATPQTELRKEMLLGIHEQYQAGPNRTTPEKSKARYPQMAVTREFKPGEIEPQNMIPSLKNLCQATWDAGLVCVVSYKFSRAEVRNNKWRPFIEQGVSWLRDNGLSTRTILVPWHEPENDFKTGGEFVEYFNKVHGWVKETDPNLYTSHAAMAYHYRDKGKIGNDNLASTWATDADIQSLDIYSGRSFPLNMTLGTSSAFKRWKATVANGQPWGVSERGWITGKFGGSAERVASIRAEFDWLTTLPREDLPYFYIVWNTEGTEDDPQIILDAAGREAVNEGFARLYEYAQTPVDPEPVPDPQPSGEVTCPLCHGDGTVDPSVIQSVTTVLR